MKNTINNNIFKSSKIQENISMNKKLKSWKEIRDKKGIYAFLPSGITSIRIILIPLFLYTLFNDLKLYTTLLFLFLCLTDYLDGYFARKLNIASYFGAYFDTAADFILILTTYSAFVINGIYSYWILILIIFMFLQFILTSKIKMPVYDPIGKYLGAVLFGGALITLIFQNIFLYEIIALFILFFSIISLSSRYIFLFLQWKKLKKS